MTSHIHSSPISAAGPLDHAARGWSVFPICGRVSPDLCSDPEHAHSASDIGKIPPRGFKWKLKATTKSNVINVWFARFPQSNWAIDTGKSNLLVIDEDTPGELARYCADRNQEMPATLQGRTAQGYHHYFRHPHTTDPIGNSNHFRELGYAIDVRGAGGYVVAPGSVHRTGVVYELTADIEPVELPGWLAQELRRSATSEYDTAELDFDLLPDGFWTAYGRGAVGNEVAKLSQARNGARNNALNKSAFRLAQLAAERQVALDIIREELTNVALTLGLSEQEIAKTIDSGIRGGLREPRSRKAGVS